MADVRVSRSRRDPCKGKRRFGKPGAARHAMKRHGHKGACRVYPCPHCGGWHFGHVDQAMGRVSRMKRVVDAIDSAMAKTEAKGASGE